MSEPQQLALEQHIQLDLFEERTAGLTRGRNALVEFDLASAKREFTDFLSLYPDNTEGRRGLTLADQLLSRLADLEREHGDSVTALLLLEDDLDDVTRKGWHRFLAREAEHRMGGGCYLASVPAGLHWLLGGNLNEAERSLRESLRRQPEDARARAYLGDVLFRKGDPAEARSRYLRAFLTGPAAVDLDRLADREVASLPWLGENEYEVPEEPMAWVPAVGTVEDIFPLPTLIVPRLEDLVPSSRQGGSRGFTFYRCLLEERSATTHEERIEIRRLMKALCPALFAAYLRRFY